MGSGGRAGPYFCCSSFILLRALPARNHSIWVSLKVWFSRMVSWVPLGCLMMHFRGCEGGAGVGGLRLGNVAPGRPGRGEGWASKAAKSQARSGPGGTKVKTWAV